VRIDKPWTPEQFHKATGQKRKSAQRLPNQPPAGWEVFAENGEPAGCVLLYQMLYSKNTEYPNHIHRQACKERWERHTIECWLAAGRPVVRNPQVQFRFYFPDKVRRDLDNYLGTAAVKGIMDGLKYRAIRDDNWQEVKMLAPTAEVCRNLPRVEVWVTEAKEDK